MHLEIVVLCLSICSVLGGNMCSSVTNLPMFQFGKRYINALSYVRFFQKTPVKCVEICLRSSLCKSVNFNMISGECQLFHHISEHYSTTTETDFMLTDVRDWPDALAGNCSNHSCPNNTICVADSAKIYSCTLVGCLWTSGLERSLREINTEILDPCYQGFYSNEPAVCQPNGTWSVPLCKPLPTDCEELKICNSSYTDGEYWLHFDDGQQNRKRMKIYCHDLSTSKPQDYVTLYHYNLARKSIFKYNDNEICETSEFDASIISNQKLGDTVFSKVGIKNMKLQKSNFAFAQAAHYLSYGSAAACSGTSNVSCPALGLFVIDLRNTSFAVSSTSIWTERQTATSFIEKITYSSNNEMVEGSCGGECGGCRVDGPLVVIKENSQPNFESATFPKCEV